MSETDQPIAKKRDTVIRKRLPVFGDSPDCMLAARLTLFEALERGRVLPTYKILNLP